MRRFLLLLLITTLPAAALAAQPPSGCGRLCGKWVLDSSHSDAAGPALDSALATYKEPKPRRDRNYHSDSPVGDVVADMERSIGPILDRPHGSDLRVELLPLVTPPAELEFDRRSSEILIKAPTRGERRIVVGSPHARVDAAGTAKISANWKAGALVISERYDRKREYIETYTLQRDGTLLVTRQLDRPGLKTIRLRALYQPG
jgi:hypothetical protein